MFRFRVPLPFKILVAHLLPAGGLFLFRWTAAGYGFSTEKSEKRQGICLPFRAGCGKPIGLSRQTTGSATVS